jgi:hypothetical protein
MVLCSGDYKDKMVMLNWSLEDIHLEEFDRNTNR